MRCWSCGSDLAGGARHFFTCPLCSAVEEQKKIRETLESSRAQSLYEVIQISAGLTEIASILEWGFEEIEWKLDQMTGVLKSIDKTLKTPSQTQANEWRQIAEELRRRRVLDESEKFYSKSLETNPLDYRTYIGLGKTKLRMEKFDEARRVWEKSLPHAPKGEIDYKSYSYRLIGRIDFCEENYPQAASTLKTAIKISPNYYLGHYDYAQYCALLSDKESCLSSLRLAIVKGLVPLELVEREKNLQSFKKEIADLLWEIKSDENLQREIKLRSIWKPFRLGVRCEDRLIEAQKRFEIEIESETDVNYLRKSYRETWNLTKSRYETWKIISDWMNDHTIWKPFYHYEKMRDTFENIIKEEMNLDLWIDMPVYKEIKRVAEELEEKRRENAKKAIKIIERDFF